MRQAAQSTATEIRTVVRHARTLLSHAVRMAWASRLLTKDPDGLFSGVLGAQDIEQLLARAESPIEEPLTPAAAPSGEGVARLRTLIQSIGCSTLAEDVLSVA